MLGGEPRLGVDVVELGGGDQGIDRGGPFAAAIGAAEGPVAAADGDTAQRSLGGIVKGHDVAGAPSRWASDLGHGIDLPPGWARREHETAAGRPDHELRARVVTWPPLRLARLRCERGSVDVVQARRLPNARDG